MNRRPTRNTPANKPFVSGGVMTNFTAAPTVPEQKPAPVSAPLHSISVSYLPIDKSRH